MEVGRPEISSTRNLFSYFISRHSFPFIRNYGGGSWYSWRAFGSVLPEGGGGVGLLSANYESGIRPRVWVGIAMYSPYTIDVLIIE